MKVGGRCGVLHIVTKNVKAELLERLQSVHERQLDILQARSSACLRCRHFVLSIRA
jgi:hypothetical protein